MKTVSAAEANRSFSKILGEVQKGETFRVTSRGKPVATIAPAEDKAADRRKALEEILERWKNQPLQYLGKFQRDWAYDD